MDDSFRSLLQRRKTNRKLKRGTLPQSYFEDLVWAAYGHTHDYRDIKMRTAPSAGATYPIELYLVCEDIEGVADGVYLYDTAIENISLSAAGQFLDKIRAASYDQKFITQCNLAVIMVYNPGKIVSDYGRDSAKYSAMECGHIAQNLLLMATSLELGAVPVGAFDQERLDRLIGLDDIKQSLYMIMIGMLA